MIFVTVGTHEQQFDRLVKFIDDLKKDSVIKEEVIIQTGFSDYEPKYCKWKKLFPYQDMIKMVNEARIVITHGGPSSFIMPLQIGKIPIVVPRKKEYGEHVNDHQVLFCKQVQSRYKNIIVVDNIEDLKENILNYEDEIQNIKSVGFGNNIMFCEKFNDIVKELMDSK